MAPEAAVMLAEPTLLPLAKPLALMEAICGAAEDQVAVLVKSLVEASL